MQVHPVDARTGLRAEVAALDLAVFHAIAATPTPRLDSMLYRLTATADHSKLWLATAAVLAAVGQRRGRRAALNGVASIGVASAAVNLLGKQSSRRTRPDRDLAAVPEIRRVPMPLSTSFPSGHSASAFAFAGGVGHALPGFSIPLALAATVVAFTRVHAGVHYPTDVIAGSLAGIACGELVPRGLNRICAARAATA